MPSSSPLIGIIAGAGELPVLVARALAGRCYLIGVDGFAEAAHFDRPPDVMLSLYRIGEVTAALRAAGCVEIVLIGKVFAPSSAGDFDSASLEILNMAARRAISGDGGLVDSVCDYFEARGFRVCAPDEFIADLRAPSGLLCGDVNAASHEDIALAVRACAMSASFDMGQGAVVVRRTVLAIEGAEGTNAMLMRVSELPPYFLGTRSVCAGVLAKFSKPQQDLRVDLPAIGVETIEHVVRAHLSGIAYRAGGALLIDRDAMCSMASSAGIFLYGITS